MIFATKSKPGPSSSAAAAQPFSGLYKRMSEGDGFYTTSTSNNSTQPNKKKAITVELQIDGPLDEGDDCADVALNEGACGGGDVEQLMNNSNSNVINIVPSGSKAQVQKPIQAGKYACTEANCTRNFRCNTDLKRHLRTHNNVRPFGCTFPGCSLEFSLRTNAIRHILNVHLKKKSGEEDPNEPPDPATYLSTKEELL
ncbi:hypothetical protein TYRP_011421 [Tyrophagus putrescentiae]|nr:hypothetical protein TYRP_011421 [Tyrophagus putrescentiae]